MKHRKKTFWRKPIALYMVLACLVMFSVPKDSWAYIVQSKHVTSSRQYDIKAVQRVLESKIVDQRLSELGLSVGAINERLDMLSDGEIHVLASKIDNLYAGSGVASVLIGLLLIAALIIILLKVTGRKIIIK